MFLPCRPCCGSCGSELDPTPCPASVSVYDCPTFWVYFASEPYHRKSIVSLDPNGATASLICGSVTVKDSAGNTLLSATALTQLPRDVSVPPNEDKLEVTVTGFGVRPRQFAQCQAWNPATPAPLLGVSCPSTRCGVAFENDRLEVTVTADDVTAIYDGTGVNDFDSACPSQGRIERRFDGLTNFNGVYELTLISEGPISPSADEREWRYDFPAFDCYAAGENFISVKATYYHITGNCGIEYQLRFYHMEQREKHSGTPSAWVYSCTGQGCPTASPCLLYDDYSNFAIGFVGPPTFEPEWQNTDIPAASADVAPASVPMNRYNLCATIGTDATLSRSSLTGNGEVSISLEFFT